MIISFVLLTTVHPYDRDLRGLFSFLLCSMRMQGGRNLCKVPVFLFVHIAWVFLFQDVQESLQSESLFFL